MDLLTLNQIQIMEELMEKREAVEQDLRSALKRATQEESYVPIDVIAEIIKEQLGDGVIKLREKL
jgi:hypothetical protein